MAELEMCVLERLKERAKFSLVMSAGSRTSKSRTTALSKHLKKPSPLQVVAVHSSDDSSSSAVSAMSQLSESIKSRRRSRRKKKEGGGTSVTSKVTKKLKEPPSTIKKAEDSSTPSHVDVKGSPFRGSLLDMTTLKPEHQKAVLDLLVGTKEDSPHSGAKPKELTFKEGIMGAALDKAESVFCPKLQKTSLSILILSSLESKLHLCNTLER